MDDVLQFKLELKEIMSGAIKRLEGTTRSAFTNIDKDINKVKADINDLGKSHKIDIDTSGIKSAQQDISNLKNTLNGVSGGSTGGGIFKGAFLGNLAARGVEMGLRGAREIAGQALDAGMDAEQQIIALKTFIGKDKAYKLYAQLQKDSALTPFTTSQILPVIQGLIASGQNVGSAKKDVWALMNALSATGNAGNPFMLELTGSHLAQMKASGFADATYMREFQRTAHIPMTALLSQSMGVPMPKIAAWTESGELKDHVTYDQFVDALKKAALEGGNFAHALEDQSQTIKGKESTIKDWWNIGMAKAILDPRTHDNITRLEDRIINGLEGLPETIGKLSPVVNRVFDEFDRLSPSMSQFTESLWSVLKPAGGLVISDEMEQLAKSTMELSSTMLDNVKPVLEDFTTNLKQAAGGLSVLGGVTGKLMGMRSDAINWSKEHLPGWMSSFMTSGVPGVISHVGSYADAKFGKENVQHWMAGGPIWGSLWNGIDKMNQGGAYPYKHSSTKGLREMMSEAGMNKHAQKLQEMMGTLGSKPKKTGSADSDSEGSDAIVGGGRKQTILNFNAPMYQVNGGQHFNEFMDSIKDLEPKVRQALLRIMYSIPGAISN